MRHDSEVLLQNAIQALQANVPDAVQVDASARRVADQLGIEFQSGSMATDQRAIENCDDVQQLRTAYRAGALSDARSSLIKAHLRDCGTCHRYFQSEAKTAVVDWSTPEAARAFNWRPRAFSWAMAPAFALLICMFFVYRIFWQVPTGVRAEVESIDGAAYRISDGSDRPLAPGDSLNEGDQLRTSGGGHAVLRLADGSTVEVNERTVLGVGERGRNTTVALHNGAVIVEAAKRNSGHLYVKTSDCRVAVTGTVFSVNAGIKGSRVAVVEGSLHVLHAGTDTLLHAGGQVTTSDNLAPQPVAQQIAWSHDRDKYLLLLAQFDVLQHRLDQIPSPSLRYTSDLLQRVPADTLLYVSIPNLGDFLSQANSIFHDQLRQSPALQQWWDGKQSGNTADLDTLVEKLHQMSQYLGDEVVVVGLKQANDPGFAIIADVQKAGLDDFLKNQLPTSDSNPHLTVFNEGSLETATASSKSQTGGYALVREHEAVVSNSIAMLKQMNAQLNAGTSGFATGEFGQQIAAAYSRGAGVILAADVQQMVHSYSGQLTTNVESKQALENTGIDGVRYLIAEHRETNGLPENHLDLQFSGTRQRVASWLAAPAPIGSLDFVTPNAALAVGFLSKDPAAIADDIMSMTTPKDGSPNQGWSEAESKLHISIRNDLAANLGGDFLLSLDGPVLPTPAWKAVIEVRDSNRLQATMERLVEDANEQTSEAQKQADGKKSHSIAITTSEAGGQQFYAVKDVTSGSTLAQYTFLDGYMIIAQDRALLMQAMHAHASGDSLARSAAFKAILPEDANANYSAVAYQNLSPVLQPLLSRFSGDLADAVRQLAADARPTAVCAWGKESHIEAASNSHLFGFDFLTLGALIHPNGNNQPDTSVKD